ncbi:MAG: homoserine O-acetyltransferase [Flavisolibacter sp.]|nr:homoserine O-acetyltransferase [Flavisolibacter sp.]
MNQLNYTKPFVLENGVVLPELTIVYHTYGTLNAAKDNAIWICHALTGNSDAQDWWPGMIGNETIFDTDQYFVVCANILGSCYGTTGPLSIHPETNQPYYSQFPNVTIRDMVKAHSLLCRHLGIQKIQILAGGSMGGYQVLEWCVMEPALIHQIILMTTSARESAWGIAIHTAQRLAIEADCTWLEPSPKAGQKGLKAARAMGMITYRNYQTYAATQSDTDFSKLDDFKAASYINYQGEKLMNRFNAFSYWLLTKSMDSHNIARGRSTSIEEVLQTIKQRALIIGISSDVLCPIEEQQFIARHLPNATLKEIDSSYGHDGFLVESERLSELIRNWMDT